MAPADHGFVKSIEGFGAAGLPGCRLDGEGCRSDGESRGEEKERRYSAIKKTSLNMQKVKRTFCFHRLAFIASPHTQDTTDIIGIVLLENPAPALVDILVTLSSISHG